MSGVTSPALPPFSYAQAARGMSLPSTTHQTAVEPQAQKEDTSLSSRKVSGPEPPSLELATRPTESMDSKDEKVFPDAQLQGHLGAEKVDEIDLKSEEQFTKRSQSPTRDLPMSRVDSPPASGPPSAQPTTTSDEASSTLKGSSDSTWDEQSQSSNPLDKSAGTLDNDKEIDADRKQKGKRKNSVVEPELKAAPIPTFNVWQERQKAQEAKAQEAKAQANATIRTQAPSGAKLVSAQNQNVNANPKTDSRKGTVGSHVEEKEGTVGREKKPGGGEGQKSKDDAKKGMAKGIRPSGETKASADSSGLLPVADATTWPTPENATFEEKKRFQAFDKSEKSEAKSPASKAHGKNKWEHVPHVPTVKFNTPLPPVATRRGGKGPGRGGRDGNARGGHTPSSSISGEKFSVTGPNHSSKQEPQRGRNEVEGENARANFQQGSARRATSVDTATAERRKPAPSNQIERSRPENKRNEEPRSGDVVATETALSGSRPRQNSKPFTKGPSSLTTPSHKSSSLTNGGLHGFSNEAQTHPRHSADRRSTHDPFRETGLGLDRGDLRVTEEFPRRRDFSGDRPDVTREKSDSWRDRDLYNNRTERRDSRSERGGRGSYRGRGSHSNFNSHGYQAHAYTAPLPQHPFQAPKSNAHSSDRSRQTSVPYISQGQTQPNNRPIPRANTMGSAQVFTPPTSGPNVPQPLTPIMTEFGAMYPYPNLSMTAPPYSQLTDSYAILQMVTTQLEYYFSVDNLCKDIFLRRHMDSQGYVPLSIVSGFKRIKTLTEDTSLIRYACQHLASIDYMPAEEGKEKIRANGHWNQWVLPMDQRDDSAKNDGPTEVNGLSALQQMGGNAGNTEANLSNHQVSMNGFVNDSTADVAPFVPQGPGYDFQMVDTPTTTAVDESKHSQPNHLTGDPVQSEKPRSSEQGVGKGAVLQTQTQNGQGSVFASPDPEENTFTNQQTETLTVVCRERSREADRIRPPFSLTDSRTFSNGSLDNHALAERPQNTVPLPALRGGAGSFNHLEGEKHMRIMKSSTSHESHQEECPVFWVKDGTPPINLHEKGLSHMPYNSLRSNAIMQRQTLGEHSPNMEILYQFWSHFLVRNYNADMYNEFHGFALNDSTLGMKNGLRYLLRYYEAMLSGQRVLPDKVATDLVDLVEFEQEESRPAFTRLRAAWRNGAFSLKSRKKIDNLISLPLRAQLEA